MIDIEREEMMTLSEGRDWLQGRFGRSVSRTCIQNWAKVGLKGIKLEVILFGGRYLTSVEALGRFFNRHEAPPPVVVITKKRQREIEEASRRAKELFG